MTLTRVTITGADDGVDAAELAALSRELPFVEWGILFSIKRAGEPRYPSSDWLKTFCAVHRQSRMRCSAHLCGRMAKETIAGSDQWLAELPPWFDRVQLNGFGDTVVSLIHLIRRGPVIEWILQVRDKESLGSASYVAGSFFTSPVRVSILWDASGGQGIVETSWPDPPRVEHTAIPMGRAGGIVPETVAEIAREVAALEYPSWIDMESGVRTDDRFDLGKVRAVLEAARPYVEAAP